MRGLICYYSGTGNTKLAGEAIARRAAAINFELFDIVRDGQPQLSNVDLVGFATWADYLNPPQRMRTFLESLPQQEGMPAFVFNTFGSISGRTLPSLDRWTSNRGFHVIAGPCAVETPTQLDLAARDARDAGAVVLVVTEPGIQANRRELSIAPREYNIERKFRETRLYQIAPISTNLILTYLAEHVLGLPRSF